MFTRSAAPPPYKEFSQTKGSHGMENLTQNSSSPLNPENFMRNWQQTGMRILRAQERMLQGVTTAAKLEMRYSQEVMESRLSLLKWSETDMQDRTSYAKNEVDKLVTLMRDVTEELRTGFTEATRLLADATEEAVEHVKETAHAGAEEASSMMHQQAEAAQHYTQTAVEAARQTTARTQRNLAKASEVVKESVAKTTELSQDTAAKAEGIISEK